MSLVHRILYAIRSLAEEEEPKQCRHKRRRRPRSSQAVALVITIHDLFSSKGISHLLEDPRRHPADLTFPPPPATKSSEAWFRETPPLASSEKKMAFALSPDTKVKPSEVWLRENPPLETSTPKPLVTQSPPDKASEAWFGEGSVLEVSKKDAEIAFPAKTKVKSSKAWFRKTSSSKVSPMNAVVTLSVDTKFKSLKAWFKKAPPKNAVVAFDTKNKATEAWLREAPPQGIVPPNSTVALLSDLKVKEGNQVSLPPLETSPLNVVTAPFRDTKVKSLEACLETTPPLEAERVLASSEPSLRNAVISLPPDLRLTPLEAWFLKSTPLGDPLQRSQCVDDRQRAVVENVVNRVREEQLKKKRKLKFFRLKFC